MLLLVILLVIALVERDYERDMPCVGSRFRIVANRHDSDQYWHTAATATEGATAVAALEPKAKAWPNVSPRCRSAPTRLRVEIIVTKKIEPAGYWPTASRATPPGMFFPGLRSMEGRGGPAVSAAICRGHHWGIFRLGISRLTAMEYFDGPHMIHGHGIFEFLREHLQLRK